MSISGRFGALLCALAALAFLADTVVAGTRGTGPDGDYTVRVKGLTAQNAKDAQAALEKAEGAKAVAVDAEKGTIAITMKEDQSLQAATVSEALKPVGLTVEGMSLAEGQEHVWLLTYSGGGG